MLVSCSRVGLFIGMPFRNKQWQLYYYLVNHNKPALFDIICRPKLCLVEITCNGIQRTPTVIVITVLDWNLSL